MGYWEYVTWKKHEPPGPTVPSNSSKSSFVPLEPWIYTVSCQYAVQRFYTIELGTASNDVKFDTNIVWINTPVAIITYLVCERLSLG